MAADIDRIAHWCDENSVFPLLLFLQTVAAAPATKVEVELSETGGACVVMMENKKYVLPQGKSQSVDELALEGALAELSRRKASVHILPSALESVSYRCVGGFIFLAQVAGVPAGFVAEPPPR